MVKRALVLVLGFGMIAGGIAGITTSLVDQKNKAALREFERAQEKTRTATAEEEKKLEEKRKEIERLAMDLNAEKRALERERHLTEQYDRMGGEAAGSGKEATTRHKKAYLGGHAKEGEKRRARQKERMLAGSEREPQKKSASASLRELEKKSVPGREPRRPLTARAHEPGPPKEDVPEVARKASLEAARRIEPVEYYNRRTGELILAEPFDHVAGSVVVRIRVWRDERLVRDTLVRVPESPPRRQRIAGVWNS